MKFKRKELKTPTIGDLKYITKFAILPKKTEGYRVWLEKYIEVWSFRYSWIRLPNRARTRELCWCKELTLCKEEYEKFKEEKLDIEIFKKIISGEKIKVLIKGD